MFAGLPIFGGVPLLRVGAGSRPGGRGTFLCFAKEKYPKERRPCCLRPSASLRATWGARARGAPWNSLRACGASFRQPRRVRSRSGCVLRHTRHPAPCAPQAQPEGMGSQQPHGPSLRSAPSRGRKRLALRNLGRAQRWPVGLFGCSVVSPIWLRLRRCGCGVSMRVEARMPRHLARRGCPSGARSAKRVPRRTQQAHRRRFAPKGPQTVGRLFFAYFLLAKQKKVRRPPGRDPASALTQRTHQAIKTIAASA